MSHGAIPPEATSTRQTLHHYYRGYPISSWSWHYMLNESIPWMSVHIAHNGTIFLNASIQLKNRSTALLFIEFQIKPARSSMFAVSEISDWPGYSSFSVTGNFPGIVGRICRVSDIRTSGISNAWGLARRFRESWKFAGETVQGRKLRSTRALSMILSPFYSRHSRLIPFAGISLVSVAQWEINFGSRPENVKEDRLHSFLAEFGGIGEPSIWSYFAGIKPGASVVRTTGYRWTACGVTPWSANITASWREVFQNNLQR